MENFKRGKRAEICVYDDSSDYDIIKFIKESMEIELLPYQEKILTVQNYYKKVSK